MSSNENITPGKVNNLIIFFEKHDKQSGRNTDTKYSKDDSHSKFDHEKVKSFFEPSTYYGGQTRANDNQTNIQSSQTFNFSNSQAEVKVKKVPKAYNGEILVVDKFLHGQEKKENLHSEFNSSSLSDTRFIEERNTTEQDIYKENHVYHDFQLQSSENRYEKIKQNLHTSHNIAVDGVEKIKLNITEKNDLTDDSNSDSSVDKEIIHQEEGDDHGVAHEKSAESSEEEGLEHLEIQSQKEAVADTENTSSDYSKQNGQFEEHEIKMHNDESEQHSNDEMPNEVRTDILEENDTNPSGKKETHNIGFEHLEKDANREVSSSSNSENHQPEDIDMLGKGKIMEKVFYSSGQKGPTVFPSTCWDPEADCKKLNDAIKEHATPEAVFLEILGKRSLAQRLEIMEIYESLFTKNLVHEIQKEAKGDVESLLLAMVTPSFDFLASELRKAVKGLGTCEDTLIEIICIYVEEDIYQIQASYEKLFGRNLKDDIFEDTSGDFRKILVSILSTQRTDPNCTPASVAEQLCQTDAKGKSKVDSDVIRTMMTGYSKPFLKQVILEYESVTEGSFKRLLTSVFSGDAEKAMIALYLGVVSVGDFFANELHASLKGLKRNDSKLIRIIVTRSEIDLEIIKDSFQHVYGKCLGEVIKKETSGNYREGLLTILFGNSEAHEHNSKN